jgi:GntR family transcriptional repressor for pyruvate dehydrogenase complex
MKLEPVARQSLVDVVAERIRDLIEREHLQAGDRLPGELQLVEQLRVSRPVLREAISRLESVGLINVRRGQGMFVGDRGNLSSCVQLVRTAMTIAPKDLTRFAELRTAIEVHAARLAAERATPEDIEMLKSICAEMDREDSSYEDAIRADFQFHRKIVEITGNEMMRNIMQVIHEFVMAGMVHTTPKPRNRTRSRLLHGAILDALEAHDPDRAEREMKAHMISVHERLQEADQRRRN